MNAISKTLLPAAGLAVALGAVMADEKSGFAPSAVTRDDVTPCLFEVPAPRGLILDRAGRVLADTVVARQVLLAIPVDGGESAEHYIESVHDRLSQAPDSLRALLHMPSEPTLKKHFQFRRRLPLVISDPLEMADDSTVRKEATDAGFLLRPVYLRHYPGDRTAAHLIGHLGSDFIPEHGLLRQREPLWRTTVGKSGIEGAMDKALSGQPGLMSVAFDDACRPVSQDTIEAPQAGNAVVLTLDLAVQRSVESALRQAGRPGAAVILDSRTGDLLASASWPTFRPADFAWSVKPAVYQELSESPRAPLFDRALQGNYPPGSVFKPVTAAAAMESRVVSPSERIFCGPELEIAGRIFRNWSDRDEGLFTLSSALVRSCNTYFYELGLRTGDRPLLGWARRFGFGSAPTMVVGTGAGALPGSAPSAQAVANLSIGQGPIDASPLQVALMMGGWCRGFYLPSPRLLQQVQDGQGRLVETRDLRPAVRLGLSETTLNAVNSGLYGVVNHERGTGKAARHEYVPVYGKTGTAQWKNHGRDASVVWFAGFVPNSTPPISFAVVMEGEPGERIFGGSTAAPVASQFLHDVFRRDHEGCIRRGPTSGPVPLQDYTLIESLDVPAAIPLAEPVTLVR
ncbi:peptidoglycan D,D-transpeptidase FtsI family protein [Haloferula sargassicola]|uniref:beta-lactamase n=1 Tax=Haloferula sargassicola TaxID=490096 RepID=A0ABP9UP13_9BACT